MAPKSGHVVLAFLCLVAVAVPVPIYAAASREPLVGGWREIEKPNDNKVVVDVAKFAVEEYNKEKNKSVVFVSVVKGEQQVVAGVNYRLVIGAEDGNYRALVWAKLDKSLQLTSFEREIVV